MNATPDPLDEVLARTAPAVDTAEFAALSAAIAAKVAAEPRVRRSSRARRVAIGIVAATAISVPAVAAAGSLGFHTGWFGDPSKNTEDADSSEYLNMCDPSIHVVIQQDQPPATAPLPTGADWDMATSFVLAMHAKGCASQQEGLMQEIGIKREYNRWAQCVWLRDAAAAGTDKTFLAEAGHALRFYGDSAVNHATDGGGIVEMDLALADRVARGDVTAAREGAKGCGVFGFRR